MNLNEILSKAISKQKVITLKVMGLGGYKATKYTFANGATLEIGGGVSARAMPRGFKNRIEARKFEEAILESGGSTRIFRMPLSDIDVGIINEVINK